jgi:hypothetical protein
MTPSDMAPPGADDYLTMDRSTPTSVILPGSGKLVLAARRSSSACLSHQFQSGDEKKFQLPWVEVSM